jgi:glycosyltransferase involved in cell wall biosynthesis
LRVAFVAGTLAQGGAEKQLTYMASALHAVGVDTRVFCLTTGEHYAGALESAGLPPAWLGPGRSPLSRLVRLIRLTHAFRPHILQAGHFFTNLYVTIAARACGAVAIGSIRSDTQHEMDTHGLWGGGLLRLPPSLLTNSHAARRNAAALGIPAARIHVLPNVIDLPAFDDRAAASSAAGLEQRRPTLVTVCRLYPVKRVDRFLRIVALLSSRVPELRALVVGDGPEQKALADLARDLGLLPGTVEFLGRRNDVPAILVAADALLVTSDHEGFPNVILEAMAAGRPVVTSPAGDAPAVVQEGVTGYVVPSEDLEAAADRLAELFSSTTLRQTLGQAGRRRAETHYSNEGLAERLLTTYSTIAGQQANRRAGAVLPPPATPAR